MNEITNVSVSVSDPAKAVRFYSGLLKSRPVKTGPDHAVFALEQGRTLSLRRRSEPQSWAQDHEVDFPLPAHVALDDLLIDWWDRGARILQPPTDVGCGRAFVARDPDGNRLRVFALCTASDRAA